MNNVRIGFLSTWCVEGQNILLLLSFFSLCLEGILCVLLISVKEIVWEIHVFAFLTRVG